MSKTKIVETALVLTTGFLVIYFIFKKPVFLFLALGFGLIGIFLPAIARFIAIAWFKLADVLNFVVSKIVLGMVYFVILFPIAFIYKSLGKDKMNFENKEDTVWIVRNKKYEAADIENIW
jgi:hypothetical protein